MQRILVTGANKGIGFAIAKQLVEKGCQVLLGARDVTRGEEAAKSLRNSDTDERVCFIQLDVSDEASIKNAAAEVEKKFGPGSLYGLVNNAGLMWGEREDLYKVNATGVKLMCDAFLPLLDQSKGRIVNVASASGPMFVAKCSDEMQAFFCSPDTSWDQLSGLLAKTAKLDNAEFEKMGLGDWSKREDKGGAGPYGLTKAVCNTLTMALAKDQPHLQINSVTPGFIATDMVQQLAEEMGRSAQDMGAKAPEEGVSSTLHCLFQQLPGNGRFYGSDCLRSPLDRYRGPGEPAYEGP